jgi:hypothetical protein
MNQSSDNAARFDPSFPTESLGLRVEKCECCATVDIAALREMWHRLRDSEAKVAAVREVLASVDINSLDGTEFDRMDALDSILSQRIRPEAKEDDRG